jgi:heat shock protein HslJ
MRTHQLVLLLLIGLALGACRSASLPAADAPPPTPPPGTAAPPAPPMPATLDRASLIGREWTLIEWSGRALPKKPVTLTFEAERFSGAAPCNRIMGPWALDDDRLQFGGPKDAVAVTRMACIEPAATEELDYLALLKSSPTVKVEGDRLTLGSDGTQLVFTSRKEAAVAG